MTGDHEGRYTNRPEEAQVYPNYPNCTLALRNLLVGLWLQFAQAVAENKSYARCKECETWFETSIPGTRKTRVYCSDTCKVKAYMERKDRAVRLKAEGKTVKQIAHELG